MAQKNEKIHKIGCFLTRPKKIKIQLRTIANSAMLKEEKRDQTLVYTCILTHI